MFTKREMDTKVCNKCKSLKLLSEFHKKKASTDGHHSQCKVCLKEYQAKYYAANPEKEKERNAKHRAAYPDYQAEYKKANPEKCRAWCSNRRAVKLEAIPSWLTKEDWQSMEDIGKESDRLTRETGIKYEVDHIHPLQGKLICGLPCPTNLQILTKSQNCSKSNKFTPYVESELIKLQYIY